MSQSESNSRVDTNAFGGLKPSYWMESDGTLNSYDGINPIELSLLGGAFRFDVWCDNGAIDPKLEPHFEWLKANEESLHPKIGIGLFNWWKENRSIYAAELEGIESPVKIAKLCPEVENSRDMWKYLKPCGATFRMVGSEPEAILQYMGPWDPDHEICAVMTGQAEPEILQGGTF